MAILPQRLKPVLANLFPAPLKRCSTLALAEGGAPAPRGRPEHMGQNSTRDESSALAIVRKGTSVVGDADHPKRCLGDPMISMPQAAGGKMPGGRVARDDSFGGLVCGLKDAEPQSSNI